LHTIRQEYGNRCFNCMIMAFRTRRHPVQDSPQLFRSTTHLWGWGEPYGDRMDRPLEYGCGVSGCISDP
jgi:hypothetical protein